ncbi:ral guanine nucleotide dissociation stimulator-like 2-like protein [Cricetulus griseus]|nr:ral guanine nucleotide dissociation stimulator-like 2-like protein [Cricetulus griseus]
MKPLRLLLAVALGLLPAVSAGPEAIECWFVEDAGRGGLNKKPAALLLRPGPRGPPPRPHLDPKLYFKVDDPAGMLLAAFRRYPSGAPAPHCEMSRFIPFPASATWARHLTPQQSCPRALDGDWLLVSVSSTVFSLSSLLRPQPEPQREPVLITMATVVLTVLTHSPAPRIQLGKDAVMDLSFAYMPPTPEDALSPATGPPPFGLEWRRQHRGKGHLLLAATPGLVEEMPPAQEKAVAFASWDDNEPWGPWTGNGTFWLPAVKPFQEGVYLATVHLPYLQGQVSLQLTVHKSPKVSLTPAPLVWAAPGEAPPELLCLVSHFYPAEGLEVEWELRGGPEGGSRKAEGGTWLSTVRHHSDGSVSQAGHLRLPPVTAQQHGVRYACRVHHPSLPASGRSAEVTLEVAGNLENLGTRAEPQKTPSSFSLFPLLGLSGPSVEDSIGLFLSAFLLLGLIKALGWMAAYVTFREDSKVTVTAASLDSKAPVSVWDEEEDGATFTVTSRQYRPLDPLAPLPPPRSSRRLRAGTLEALVRYLLDARTSGVDVTFTPALLATHRAFTSTPALLGLVADRLEALESQPPGELERTTGVAISVLSTWLASHPEDFGSEVKGQLDRLESFLLRTGYAAQEGVGGGSADLIRNLRARVDPRAPNLPKPLALPGDSPADPTDVLVFLADHLAEQLTLLDAELFLNLIPSQCLGGLWGHRDRPGHSHLCPSVRATVTQFNKVAGAVVSSVLGATSIGEGPGEVTVRPLRPPQRARLLEKWIRVAEECRLLRNFSSVYAVVSALQSSPVHRLRAAWGEAARDSLRVFSSLCQIFSEEDNYSQSRELLTQEVKLQPPAEPHSKKAPRSGSRGGGVVPYLGTFLKDLVMLDAASKDELENGYINFDKRRKEFAVLSELLRLQNECRGYDLRPDPDIQQWLQGLQPLTEAQSHRVSCDVEPPGTSDSPAARMLRPTLVVSQWTEVLGSVGGPTPLVSWDRPSVGDEAPGTPAPLLTRLAQHMKWPSVSSLDSALESSPSLHGAAGPSHLSPPASSPRPSRGHRRSASCGSPLSGGTGEGASRSAGYGGGVSGPESSDCRIIRVQMELGEDGSVYKSILVTSQDKAPSVISRVLKKNNRDSAVASEFELVQLLPGERELTIPPSANVFYAMDGSSHDFLLRQRRRTSVATPGAHTGPSASGTPPSEGGGGSFPRIKATGRKIARALF